MTGFFFISDVQMSIFFADFILIFSMLFSIFFVSRFFRKLF